MKKDIHPDYREVVFQDVQSDFKFLTRSTIKSEETIKWEDGKEYPLVKVEVSSASHPFYTGKKIFVDTAGRVDKFNKKYQSLQAAKDVADKKIKEEKSEPKVEELKVKNEISENSDQEKEINAGEISEDVSSKEIKDEHSPAVEESKEEAPAVEKSKEEAPAVEKSKEEAPAAEESKEEAPAADSTSEDTQKEDS